jgi:hypothetical protein
MNEAAFRAMLTRAVRRRWLTRTQAQAYLRQFQAGQIAPAQLPAAPRFVRPTALRSGQRDALQDQFERDAAALVETFVIRSNVEQWHRETAQTLANYLLAQALSADPSRADMSMVVTAITEQQSFLQRFAEALAIALLAGLLPSPKALTARLQLYSGAGRALWYLRYELRYDGPGIVVDYDSVDDKGTCAPCIEAERGGPYLMGQGPMPGAVCRGRGRCRCQRRSRYDLAAYQRLALRQ